MIFPDTHGFALDPDKTAIVVIDIQNGFCSADGSMDAAGADISMMSSTIPYIRNLVETGRSRGVLDIWTKQIHHPDDVTRAQRIIPSHADRWAGGPPGLKGTWDSEFCDGVADLAVDPAEVIVKHRFSAFFDTRLDTLLRMKGIRTLIITGVATTHCVESTVRDGYQRDYDIIVGREAVGSFSREPHDASLWMIDRFFGRVLPCDDVLRLVSGETLGIEFRQGYMSSDGK